MAISMQQALGELSAAFAGVSVTSREVGVRGSVLVNVVGEAQHSCSSATAAFYVCCCQI
jgi:hypothetical protein